jgi:hypothetical protein
LFLITRARTAALLLVLICRAQSVRLRERAKLAGVLTEGATRWYMAAAPRPRHLDDGQGAPGGRPGAGRALATHAGARPCFVRRALVGGRETAAQPLAAHRAPPFRDPAGLGALGKRDILLKRLCHEMNNFF